MVASISGSSTFYSPPGVGEHRAGLEAELNRYKSQLADWCQCESSKTDAGKAKIRELTDKVNQAESRLQKVGNHTKNDLEKPRQVIETSTPTNTYSASATNAPGSVNPSQGTIGRLIDVRA